MKYNTIIFDLDGTLLDTLEDLKNSVNHTLSQYNYSKRTITEIRSFIGNGVRVLLQRAFPENISSDVIDNALIIFKAHYALHMYDHTSLYPGILDMLQTLRESNYRLAIVSNKLDSAVKELNLRFLNDLISIAIGTGEKAKKPNPFHVIEAIELLHSTTEHAIYVGDSDVDIETSVNAGIPCVGVSWGFRGREFLENHHADYVIDDPCELPYLLEQL